MSVMARLKAAGVECYSRAEWGSVRPAAYAKRRTTHPMPDGPAPFHFLHITVTPDTDTVLEGMAGARKVESYGLSTPPMVSYHGLVTNEGKWFEGQNYGVKGTHTINDKDVPGFPHDLNRYGYALAIMQNIHDAVTETQVQVLAMGFAAAELDGFVVRGAPIYPHRKFAYKDCPGDKAVALLGRIRILKDQYVRNGLPGKPTTPNPVEDDMSDADVQKINAYTEAVSIQIQKHIDQVLPVELAKALAADNDLQQQIADVYTPESGDTSAATTLLTWTAPRAATLVVQQLQPVLNDIIARLERIESDTEDGTVTP